jgi:23S rRNA pseudouridine1911/1915/1917 synthase
VGTPAAKPAVTRFRVRERLGDFSLLDVEPETGRQHQIRVHLAALGHPLAVDPVYGKRTELAAGDALLSRLSLHAERLEVEGLDVVAPWPEDLRAIVAALRATR